MTSNVYRFVGMTCWCPTHIKQVVDEYTCNAPHHKAKQFERGIYDELSYHDLNFLPLI